MHPTYLKPVVVDSTYVALECGDGTYADLTDHTAYDDVKGGPTAAYDTVDGYGGEAAAPYDTVVSASDGVQYDTLRDFQLVNHSATNYAEGDYFYAFSTSWSYTADQDYVITDITTDIRLPNGDPAPIDENSSVIYKVIKNKVMPLNPQIVMKINKEKGA